MVTKEQCILDKILDELNYGHNERLAEYIVAAFNQGKQYASEMLFLNDEKGFNKAFSYYLSNGNAYDIFFAGRGSNDFDPSSPIFMFDGAEEIRSVDGYDLERMLTPEDAKKILCQDVMEELDDSDLSEAFDSFIQSNYPDFYKIYDYDWLDELGNGRFSSYDFLSADWNELVKQLQAYAGQQQRANGTVVMTENDFKRMTKKIAKEMLKKK